MLFLLVSQILLYTQHKEHYKLYRYADFTFWVDNLLCYLYFISICVSCVPNLEIDWIWWNVVWLYNLLKQYTYFLYTTEYI